MNIVDLFLDEAQRHPFKDAIITPHKKLFQNQYFYKKTKYSILSKRTYQYARGFINRGIKKGDRVLVFLKPSIEFPTVTFALFYIGAIPVFIDPGMGRKNLLLAIKEVSPKIIIAERKVHFLKFFLRKTFSSVKISLSRSDLKKFGRNLGDILFNPVINEDDLAAILFTSGGTGIPKGVEYTHKVFLTQTHLLKELFSLAPKDIDFACFPLFALFTLSMGMCVVIPDMDASRPAQCDPYKLVTNILYGQPTFAAGSPAIWERIANYCILHQIQLKSIKTLAMFGAPVSLELHQKFKKILPHGTTATPYGATECLPVSLTTGETILRQNIDQTNQGKGTCIGRPVPGIEVKIIPNIKGSIEDISEITFLKNFERGEIVAKGPQATKNYLNIHQTEQAKIRDQSDGSFWHRMGDLAYFDDNGNLWFCGRKSHLVKIFNQKLYSIPCEAIFNQHPLVKKTALIGLVDKEEKKFPAIIIERYDSKKLKPEEKDKFFAELKLLGKKFEHTKGIIHFALMKKLPVDTRHNIKIDRPLIAKQFQKNLEKIQS